jgi:hypothetical protein
MAGTAIHGLFFGILPRLSGENRKSVDGRSGHDGV